MSGGFEIRIKHRLSGFELEVDIRSDTGGVTALFGPSGAGKTSVINAIAGLTTPNQAYIRLGDTVFDDTERGTLIPPHQRRIGYVFQDARLFPTMSVEDNLRYPMQFHERQVTLGPIVEMLGISHLLGQFPKELSGGEAQRVAIGRALMSAPDVLLMDEPLASLDQSRRDEILPYLDQLHQFSETQIIYVSHSMAEVARLADTIVLMRDGRVVRIGSARDILSDPSAVAEIGVREAGAVLDAKVLLQDAGDGLSAMALSNGRLLLPRVDAPDGAVMRVRILASDVILSRDKPDGLSALNILPANVTVLQEGTGPGIAVGLQSGSDRLVARVTRRSARALKLEIGSSCFAVIKAVSVARGSVGRHEHEVMQEGE